MELKNKYPEAFRNVMKGTIRFVWDQMGDDVKEQTLIDITKNIQFRR